jgi:hypothetical protein
MQAWEYKVLHRQRQVRGGTVGSWDANVIQQLPDLGAEGWELVAVVPRSSEGAPANAGVTTDELWIFKRPKAIVSAEAMVVVAEAVDGPQAEPELVDVVAESASRAAQPRPSSRERQAGMRDSG